MLCECNASLSNTGRPGCDALRDITKHVILTPTYADDNSRNRIDLTATLNQAFFDALINNADDSKRIYPVRNFVNVTDVREVSEKETLNDGRSVRIRDGQKTFLGYLLKHSHNYLDKLIASACVDLSAYIVDIKGNLIGSNKTDGFLTPIRIDKETIDILMNGEPNDSEASKLMLQWQWDNAEEDRYIRMIGAGSITGIDLLDLQGLIDLYYNGTPTVSSATAFQISLKTSFGTLLDPYLQSGFVAADFNAYNNTTASSIVITSVTESANGVYDFVIPAQTTGNKVVISLDSSVTGFDDSGFENVELTML